MNIEVMFSKYSPLKVEGNADIEIKGIATDSREVRDGYVFFAMSGDKTDGLKFVEEAAKMVQVRSCLIGKSRPTSVR